MRAPTLLCCIALLGCAPPVLALQPLRFSVATSLSMPYASFAGDRLVGGIMFDLAQALAQQAQLPVEFVVLPRKRISAAVEAGDIDVRCYLSPKFVESPDRYVWSSGLFEISDVVFGAAQTPEPQNLDALPPGSAISAVIGYVYPSLDSYFSRGRLKRDDSTEQETVLRKVSARRTSYGLSDSVALDWYQHSNTHHGLASWRLVVARRAFQCAVPKNGAIDPARLLRTFDALKKSRQVEEILRRYR